MVLFNDKQVLNGGEKIKKSRQNAMAGRVFYGIMRICIAGSNVISTRINRKALNTNNFAIFLKNGCYYHSAKNI